MNLRSLTGCALLAGCLAVSPAAVFTSTAGGQEILPFPPTPSGLHGGTDNAGLQLQEAGQPRYRLPEGAPNILIILIDDVGPADRIDLRRRDPHADSRSGGARRGISYNRFHSTADVLAHAGLAAHRAQSHLRRQWPDLRARKRLGTVSAAPFRSPRPPSPRCSRTTATTPAAFGKWHNTPAEQTTSRGRSTTGRPAMASSISTDFWPARPRSTSRHWCATQPWSSIRRRPADTSTTT